MFGLFEKTDPESETHWQNIAITAFKYLALPPLHLSIFYITRLFDKNFDGYIDKKEFKWMTTSDIISNKTINIVFDVNKLILIDVVRRLFYILYLKRCDADGDGKLDYQEFKAMIFRLKARKEEAAQLEEDRLRKLGRKKQIKKDPKKTKGKGKGKNRK